MEGYSQILVSKARPQLLREACLGAEEREPELVRSGGETEAVAGLGEMQRRGRIRNLFRTLSGHSWPWIGCEGHRVSRVHPMV